MSGYYGWVPDDMSEEEFLALPNSRKRSLRQAEAKSRGSHTRDEWLDLVREFGNRCVMCWEVSRDIVKDHIVPLYQDPDDTIENIQPLCRSCNAAKGPDTTNWKALRRADCARPVV